jgi:PKD repeat protein
LEQAKLVGGKVWGSHTYLTPGRYTVHVTVYDAFTSASTTQTVTVASPIAYTPTLAAAPGRVKPGATVSLRGEGFKPGEAVRLVLASQVPVERSVIADARGAVVVGITVPMAALDGTYPVTAVGASSKASTSADVIVQAKGLTSQTIVSLPTGVVGYAEQAAVQVQVPSDATGRVEIYADGHLVANATIGAGGTVAVRLPRLPIGQHQISADFLGDSRYEPSSAQAQSLTVIGDPSAPSTEPGPGLPGVPGVQPETTAPVSPVAVVAKAVVAGKAFKKNTKPAVSVTVTLSDKAKPVGKVGIRVNGKLVKTVALKAGNKGKITVRLPKKYSKTIKISARFTPSSTQIKPVISPTRKLTVKK